MNILTGFHAIEEQLRLLKKKNDSLGDIEILYSKIGPRVKKILAIAKELNLPCLEKTETELDKIVSSLHETSRDHRGLVLSFKNEQKKRNNFVDFDAYMAQISSNNIQDKTVILLDGVTDPHNVGAIIRSCDQLGVDLLVIPERGSVFEGDVVARSSAGALSWVAISVVPNLVRVVEKLQEQNFWVYAASAKGNAAHEIDFTGNTALVLGSEGSGISRLLSEKCDSTVSISTCGKLDSLNVSVATGVLLYEIRRQKLIVKK